MGSLLGSLLADIFMELIQKNLITTLKSYLCNWKQHVDNRYAYVQPKRVNLSEGS